MNGGGAIQNGGNLVIQNSIFLRNQFPVAGGGGAIQNGSIFDAGTVSISCTLFEQNSASYGGALLNVNGSMNVFNSMFKNNQIAGNPFSDGGAAHNVSSTLNLSLNNNYWPTWNGAIPIPGGDNPSTPGQDTINIFVTVGNVLAGDPTGTANCPNPRPRRVAPTPDQELLDYQIDLVTLAGSWDSYLNDLLAGTRNTAIALAIQSIGNSISTDDSPIATFRRVMIGNGPNLILERDSLTNNTVCVTTGDIPKIECGTGNTTSQYTITHEYGHLFSYRTGQQGTGSLVNRMSTVGSSVKDFYPIIEERWVVFGVTTRDSRIGSEWYRGLFGWGSGAIPWRSDCKGPVSPTSVPTNFQQNPCDIVNLAAVDPNEAEEASADMFLNWVYKILGDGGFLNKTWYAACDTNINSPQCDDGGRQSGDARYQWMRSQTSATYAANSSW
ncbi:MAG: hypothetical protein J0M33_28385 [Anaerolineae bacterium]|nr:hypothetical protein [Anaerolineae bacterium]